jgi:hypothetical protein
MKVFIGTKQSEVFDVNIRPVWSRAMNDVFTGTEIGLIRWCLLTEIERCYECIRSDDVDEIWTEKYLARIEVAKSALDKMKEQNNER